MLRNFLESGNQLTQVESANKNRSHFSSKLPKPQIACPKCGWDFPLIRKGKIHCKSCGYRGSIPKQEPKPVDREKLQTAIARKRLTSCVSLLESGGYPRETAIVVLRKFQGVAGGVK